jgi:RND family efflux transporter MFP subunit
MTKREMKSNAKVLFVRNKGIWFFFLLLTILIIIRLVQTVPEKLSSNKKNYKRQREESVSVKTEKIRIADISETEVFAGTLTAKGKQIVSPKVAGRLTQIKVNIGDKVKKGSIVALIDSYNYQQVYDKTRAGLTIARANYSQAEDAFKIAEKEMAHQKELFNRGFLSQSEFDQSQSQYISSKSKYEIAKANIESASADYKNAEADLKACQIKAEWESSESYRYIGELFVEEGIWLNKGQDALTLLNVDTLTGIIHVTEEKYPLLQKGMSAEVRTDTWPDRIFEAKVIHIAPQLQEDSRQARVELEVLNKEGLLKPGMFSRITLKYQEKKMVNIIPASAYYKHQGEMGVFWVNPEDQTVKFIGIVTGIHNKDFIEIQSPEMSGEVVTVGQDKLKNDIRITTADKTKSNKKEMRSKK